MLIGSSRIKTFTNHDCGERANGYSARHSPAKIGGASGFIKQLLQPQ